LITNCYSWNRSKSAEEEKDKKPITQSINEESTIPNNKKKKIKLGGDSSSCQKSEKWISKQSMLSSTSFFFYCKCKEKRVKIMGMGVCVCV
jgi:hypothetical protein